jgi:HPt (histidine-containing phosphotransfer) domain-containing protein
MSCSAVQPPGAENREEIEGKLRTLASETDPEFALDLIEQFRSAAEPMLLDLRDALARPDAASARRIAHTLKGNCATFGLMRLAGQLQVLETACLQQPPPPPDDCDPVMERFRAANDLLAATAETVLGRG